MINVVLASELDLLREGMKRILATSEDIHIFAEVKCLEELDYSRQALPGQVIVLAISPAKNSQSFLRSAKDMCPAAQMIVVTYSLTLPHILSALRNGARGVLSATCAVGHLPAAIRAVSSGRVYIQENISQVIVRGLHGLQKDHTHKALTEREMEVFMKLATGLRVTDIASELGISVKTVSTHKGRMMEKMGITSFSQLVQYALANNLYDTTSPRA